MKYLFVLGLIFITLFFVAGCNQRNTTIDNSNPIGNSNHTQKASCTVYQTNSGIFVNNTGNLSISKLSLTYKISWIDSVKNGLVEKHITLDKNYVKDVLAGEVKQLDNLSVCLPEERKGKSNLFKCTAIVNSPCKSDKIFAISYNYYENGTEEFTSPALDDYITMYKNLKAKFG